MQDYEKLYKDLLKRHEKLINMQTGDVQKDDLIKYFNENGILQKKVSDLENELASAKETIAEKDDYEEGLKKIIREAIKRRINASCCSPPRF